MNYTTINNNEKDYYQILFSKINIDSIIQEYTEFIKNNNVLLKEFKLEKLNNLKSDDNLYKYINFSIKHFTNIMVDIITNSSSLEEYKCNITNKFMKEVNNAILVIDDINSNEIQKKNQHMVIDIFTFSTNKILSVGTLVHRTITPNGVQVLFTSRPHSPSGGGTH